MKLNLKMVTITLSALALTATVLGRQATSPQHIDVVASRFSFEPHEITVKKGDPVTLTVPFDGCDPRTW